MMKRLSYLLLGVLMVACSSVDCPVDSSVTTLYQFRNSDGTEYKLSDTLTVTSQGAGGKDTTLYNKAVNVTSLALPISYQQPEDVLVFHFDNSNKDLHVVDTVWLKKDDYPHFESVDCSATYFHTITGLRYTCNNIDSIVINNPSVTYDSQTVHFYLYPKSSN